MKHAQNGLSQQRISLSLTLAALGLRNHELNTLKCPHSHLSARVALRAIQSTLQHSIQRFDFSGVFFSYSDG